MFKLEPTILWL